MVTRFCFGHIPTLGLRTHCSPSRTRMATLVRIVRCMTRHWWRACRHVWQTSHITVVMPQCFITPCSQSWQSWQLAIYQRGRSCDQPLSVYIATHKKADEARWDVRVHVEGLLSSIDSSCSGALVLWSAQIFRLNRTWSDCVLCVCVVGAGGLYLAHTIYTHHITHTHTHRQQLCHQLSIFTPVVCLLTQK